MLLINGNWENTETLHDISAVIRTYFSRELADVMDGLIPEHTDDEFESLDLDYNEAYEKIDDLEDEVSVLKTEIEDLREENRKLEEEIDALKDDRNT